MTGDSATTRTQVQTPPDVSRWYVVCSPLSLLRAVKALDGAIETRDSSRCRLLVPRLNAHGCTTSSLVRVYRDGSAYVATGERQEYVANWGELWRPGDMATWERFRALVTERRDSES